MQYELDGDGLYACRDGLDLVPHIGTGLHEVAVGYSVAANGQMWRLHRHGSPAIVRQWLEATQAAYKAQGGFAVAMADSLHMLQGRFDLGDLNEALRDPSQVERLVRQSEKV